jgi:hypothetical protein
MGALLPASFINRVRTREKITLQNMTTFAKVTKEHEKMHKIKLTYMLKCTIDNIK